MPRSGATHFIRRSLVVSCAVVPLVRVVKRVQSDLTVGVYGGGSCSTGSFEKFQHGPIFLSFQPTRRVEPCVSSSPDLTRVEILALDVRTREDD